MTQNEDCLASIQKVKTIIIENVNFRNGVFENLTEKMLMNGLVIDVCWKGNIHLRVYDRRLRYYYIVLRNEEQVSASYYANKPDERFLKSIQKLVDEIENGDYNKKKTQSEKVMEIVHRRELTSYMNQTKWKEFLHAMTAEISTALPYDYKTLFEDSHEELYWGTSYDRESFNYYDFKSIEWVKVKPRFEEHTRQGRLVDDKITYHNAETEFSTLMKKYSIPYKYDSAEDVYVIYGYR